MTWGCYPPSINSIRMGRKQLWMPRKFYKFKTDCGVFPSELCWDGRRMNDVFPECLFHPLTTRHYFIEQMEKNPKLSLQIWSACLRLETLSSLQIVSQKKPDCLWVYDHYMWLVSTKYIKSCWIVLSSTGKEKKCPKQLTDYTWAGTWYCNQFLHGDREIGMTGIAQEQTKRSIIWMSIAFTRQYGNGNSPRWMKQKLSTYSSSKNIQT